MGENGLRHRRADKPYAICRGRCCCHGCCQRRGLHCHSASRSRGAALPVVLMLSSMMLVTSAAWFETSITAARGATNLHGELIAFHAADAALKLCAQRVVAGTLSAASSAPDGEPGGWKSSASFDAGAFTPVASWPGSERPAQCLVEGWHLSTRPAAQAWLITARGYGPTVDAQAWLQLQLVVEAGATERHWRRVAARPF